MGANTFAIVNETTQLGSVDVDLSSCVVSTSGHEGMGMCYWTCPPAITGRKVGQLCKTTVPDIRQQAVQDSDPQRKKTREGNHMISPAFGLLSGGDHRKGTAVPLS